ncbi:hypothetical protein A3Q56_03350 [Intoshia linei]|uniref:DH domain-containing protein n=1 Tax=Intoshia linei TaxID=1819745 RepID=A0A177B3V3_9BILA|nr:hypothetical protein A3Q56_03350 [Intoshia linei]
MYSKIEYKFYIIKQNTNKSIVCDSSVSSTSSKNDSSKANNSKSFGYNKAYHLKVKSTIQLDEICIEKETKLISIDQTYHCTNTTVTCVVPSCGYKEMKIPKNKLELIESVNKKILISKTFANVDVADIKIVENVDEIKIVKSVSVEFLDKQRRKLKYIIDEIINTEINYVEFVKYTIKNYLIYSIKDKNRPSDLSDGRLKMVFGNIKELENIHVNLILPQLKIAQYDYNLISKTFLDHESKLFKYLKYCRNKPFSEYIVNSNESYFEKIRYNIADNDGISSLLMKPIQRITRYQLLLKDIRDTVLKIGESAEIADKAYKLMIIIPNQANYMMDLSRLDGFNVDISIHGKVVITEKLKVLFDNDSKYQNVQVKQCFLLEHRFLIANIVEIHCSNIQDRYSFVCEYSTYDILCFNNENDLIMAENEQYSLILTPRKDESDTSAY